MVQVAQAIDRGGLEMMAVDLAVALKRRGLKSSMVTLDEGGRLEERLRDEGVAFYNLGSVHYASPGSHARVRQLLRGLRPTVLHTHHLPPLLNTLPAALSLGGVRTVHTEHAYQYLETAPRLRLALRVAMAGVGALAVVGAQLAPFYIDVVGVPRGRVHVVPNGVDTARFTPRDRSVREAGREQFGASSTDVIVGAVGRLAPEKHFALLIRAVATARAAGAPVIAAIVGDGEERPALEALATELGVREHVRFLGWRTDVAALVPSLDVLAVTSWSEGLPLVVLEAMASGVPVVSTAVGDIPHVLDEGAAGVLTPPGDAGALAGAFTRLAASTDERAQLATRGRCRVVERYSQAAMVDAYLDLYGIRTNTAA